MADADPPDKVYDGESPGHRNVDPPDTDAHGKEIGGGVEQDQNEDKR